MKKIIIGIVIMLSIMQVLAVSFSPSNLIFNLEQNEKFCQTITFDSSSEKIIVSDKWAASSEENWSVKAFNTSASEHSLSLEYASEVLKPENEIEVCISGTELGEYHGVILMTEEQEGNSIIQMGVWIKVIIGEKPVAPVDNPNNGGSSGAGGGISQIINKTNTATNIDQIDNIQNTDDKIENKTPENKAGITGAVIGGGKIVYWVLGAVIILVVGFFIYSKRDRSPRYE